MEGGPMSSAAPSGARPNPAGRPKRKAPPASILYDAPGPKAQARFRTYSVLSLLALAGLVGLVLWQMQRTGQFEYEKWEYFVTPDYLEVIFVDGVVNTVKAAVIAILAALALGLLFGVGKLSEHSLIRWPSWLWVEFFRAVPLLLLIIYIYFSFGTKATLGIGALWSLVAGLALYNGAVLAEIVRAGILALPQGQSEAAYAIGMTKGQVTRIVLLPQAIKIMLPAMISQFVVCLKDTSLGYAIVAPGLTRVFKAIWTEGANQVQAIIVLAAIYILLNIGISSIAHWAQRRYIGEGKAAPMADEAA